MDRLNLETPLAESAEDQSESDEVTVNIHSFFLLPFLILVGIGILFGVYILGITLLTQESRDVYDLLETKVAPTWKRGPQYSAKEVRTSEPRYTVA